jgi:hypothetical protein
VQGRHHVADRTLDCCYPNARTRLQSSFTLITLRPIFFASSKSAGAKMPTCRRQPRGRAASVFACRVVVQQQHLQPRACTAKVETKAS